jgi:hypothetical protein
MLTWCTSGETLWCWHIETRVLRDVLKVLVSRRPDVFDTGTRCVRYLT